MRLAVNEKEASFEKLILTLDEYCKSRINSREVYVKGNLYDVKSVNIIGDKAELLVINDLKEKIILQQIKGFLQKSNSSKKDLPNQLQKFLSVNYLASAEGQLIYFPGFSDNFYFQLNPGTLSEESEIPSPPPKFC